MFKRWIAKIKVKRLLKGLKRNAEEISIAAYYLKTSGAFKQILNSDAEVFPKSLLLEGREVELEVAEACEKLARKYRELIEAVEDFIKTYS